jgi:hypothetical protein
MGKYDDRVFLVPKRNELARSIRNKKWGHHIFPYKVCNLFIIYFQFHLETFNYFTFNNVYSFY